MKAVAGRSTCCTSGWSSVGVGIGADTGMVLKPSKLLQGALTSACTMPQCTCVHAPLLVLGLPVSALGLDTAAANMGAVRAPQNSVQRRAALAQGVTVGSAVLAVPSARAGATLYFEMTLVGVK